MDIIEKVNHWSAMAKLTSSQESVLSAYQLDAIAKAFRALLQRAEAAEAKLAELEKQEPVGWMTDVEVDELHRGIADEAYIYRRADATSTIPLFTRPSQND